MTNETRSNFRLVHYGEYDARTQGKTEYSLAEIGQIFPENHLAELVKELGGHAFSGLFEAQEQLGLELFLEGGIVRDTLVGLEGKDFDFIVRFKCPTDGFTTADYIQRFENFFGPKIYPKGEGNPWIRQSFYGTLILTGERFGVYKFLPNRTDIQIDLAFPRTEFSPESGMGGAKNIIVQSDPLMEVIDDVSRRDFTVNGIGMRLTREKNTVRVAVVDYVDGISDLQNRILRAIGDPYARFSESLDRIPRAIRFAQKGFTIEDETMEAMKRMIAGDGVNTETRAFRRKYADRRFVISREIVAVNILKAMKANPIGTLDLLEETGALEDMFPDLRVYHGLGEFGQDIPKELRLQLKHPDYAANTAMRAGHYADAKLAIEEHLKKYPDADLDELFFLLFLDLGKSQETLSSVKTGRQFHHPAYRKVSQLLAGRMIKDAALTSPGDARYRIHPEVIHDWLEKHYEAVSLFSRDTLVPNGRLMVQLKRLFPLFLSDPLWRLVKTDLEVSPNARSARDRIVVFENLLRDFEITELNKPGFLKGMLNGKHLLDAFAFTVGPKFKMVLRAGEITYSDLAIESKIPLTMDLVRRRLFTFLIQHSEIRKHWRSLITDKDIEILLGKDASPKQKEMFRRLCVEAIERRAALAYLGKTLEEIIEDESPDFAGTDHSLTAFFKKRSDARRMKDVGTIGMYFVTALSRNPRDVLAWLTDGIGNDASIVHILFPEVSDMFDCTQDPRNHAEGNVWTHTQMLFVKALELGIPLDPDTVLAFFYHDSGKPDVRAIKGDKITFYGHAEQSLRIFRRDVYVLGLTSVDIDVAKLEKVILGHDTYYGKTPNALDIRRDFPDGSDDLLLRVMRCDAVATVNVRKNLAVDAQIAAVGRVSDAIICEKTYHPHVFDELLDTEELKKILAGEDVNAKILALYELYLSKITPETYPSPQELVFELISGNLRWTLDYVKTQFLPGRAIIEKFALNGPEIGNLQKKVARYIYDRKAFPTETEIEQMVKE